MLNFLRKLRKSNMNGKYIKYALGEIFLVVIGILIAFQVNEWRDHQRLRTREKKSIELLIADLENEKEIFTLYRNRIDQQERSIITFLKGVSLGAPKDSLSKYAFRATNQFLYRTNNPTFDGMRQNGELSLIRNDSLRNAIVQYFDSRITYLNELQALVTKDNDATKEALLPYFGQQYNEDNGTWELTSITNLNSFKNDQAAINQLGQEGNNLEWLSYRLESLFIPENENLSCTLERYLLDIQ